MRRGLRLQGSPDASARAVALFHSAQLELKARNLPVALKLYDAAIAHGYPDPARAHNGAALCHSLLEQHVDAREVSARPQTTLVAGLSF